MNPRDTRRQLRARRVVEIVPVERLPISPPPRDSLKPWVAFAFVGIVFGGWGLLYLIARGKELVAGGW